jgi:glycosyltransferase involved in cell wall biosynthesis
MSVVIPASNRPPTLDRCVTAIEAGLHPGDELIVQTEPGGTSPARLRNVGAMRATGDVVLFVDADIVVHPDAIERLRAAFDADPELVGAFGSYDDTPPGGTVAMFRNLLHHYVHRSAAGPASTFWAGLGAVRRETFLAAGGFDDRRYPRPMLEDVELGLRLTDDGEKILLMPEITGTHLKTWSLRQMARTDVRDRGVPWARLLLERRRAPAVLNLGWRHRLSALSVLAIPVLLVLGLLWAAAACAVAFVALNHDFYALLVRRMGLPRAVVGVGLHALHHFLAIFALGFGILAHLRRSHALPRPKPLESRLSEPRAARERF